MSLLTAFLLTALGVAFLKTDTLAVTREIPSVTKPAGTVSFEIKTSFYSPRVSDTTLLEAILSEGPSYADDIHIEQDFSATSRATATSPPRSWMALFADSVTNLYTKLYIGVGMFAKAVHYFELYMWLTSGFETVLTTTLLPVHGNYPILFIQSHLIQWQALGVMCTGKCCDPHETRDFHWPATYGSLAAYIVYWLLVSGILVGVKLWDRRRAQLEQTDLKDRVQPTPKEEEHWCLPEQTYFALGNTVTPSTSITETAFFTGNPAYFSLLLRLNSLIRQHSLPIQDPAVYESLRDELPQWMSRQEMMQLKQFRLTEGMHRDLVHKLNVLFTIPAKPESLIMLLQEYIRPGQELSPPPKVAPALDEHGRAFARASRKSAKVQAWVVAGTGEIYINGVHVAEYFKQIQDRELIVRPFELGNALGAYNVWAVVEGGGLNGQAAAVAVAVARGLTVHQPELNESFSKMGLTKIDRRQVERKKTGQPKARKKNTWLKR
ncbi:37S ribosomal protein S9, mitochondrial [Chytriomyces hyalinus]|nr:37S ribosomal protein S9, mitochondrial [Chytriomyces hyalinus]